MLAETVLDDINPESLLFGSLSGKYHIGGKYGLNEDAVGDKFLLLKPEDSGAVDGVFRCGIFFLSF